MLRACAGECASEKAETTPPKVWQEFRFRLSGRSQLPPPSGSRLGRLSLSLSRAPIGSIDSATRMALKNYHLLKETEDSQHHPTSTRSTGAIFIPPTPLLRRR